MLILSIEDVAQISNFRLKRALATLIYICVLNHPRKDKWHMDEFA